MILQALVLLRAVSRSMELCRIPSRQAGACCTQMCRTAASDRHDPATQRHGGAVRGSSRECSGGAAALAQTSRQQARQVATAAAVAAASQVQLQHFRAQCHPGVESANLDKSLLMLRRIQCVLHRWCIVTVCGLNECLLVAQMAADACCWVRRTSCQHALRRKRFHMQIGSVMIAAIACRPRRSCSTGVEPAAVCRGRCQL